MILVLVDVDNLIGSLPAMPAAGQLSVGSVLPGVVRRVAGAPTVTVCMAMNLKSAALFSGWPHVQEMARAIATSVVSKVGALGTEVALCLSVPESADRALLKTLTSAPAPETEPVDELWVFSKDRGLLGMIENALKQLCHADRQDGYWRWPLPSGFFRNAPEPTISTGEADLALPKITARIDRPGRCVAVAARQVQTSTDWPLLLEIVARNPWVLSQIGVTFHDGLGNNDGSTRGVARLRNSFDTTAPVTLECAPSDGLEYGVEGTIGAWLATPQNPVIREASIGAGAVRLEWQENGQARGLTLRSQIPSWLAASAPGTIRVTSSGEPRFDEAERLGTLSGAASTIASQVRIRSYGGNLHFKVVSGRSCWWWSPSSDPWKVPTPKATWREAAFSWLDVHPSLSNTTIDAVQGVAPGARLYVRSILPGKTSVALAQPLSVGVIGLGKLASDRTRTVAVLATRALKTGPLECKPIQDVSPVRLQKMLEKLGCSPLEAVGWVPLLHELPLVVPASSRSDQAT